MSRRLTAVLMITAAVLTNLGFTVLGTVFDYPGILKEPTDVILAEFREHQLAVTAWFTVLAASAALFAPIAIGVGRLSPSRTMRVAVWTGIAAAIVQAMGLLRWPLLVPIFAGQAASPDPAVAASGRQAFVTAHSVLGGLVGETLGYLLTAAWTVLVVIAVGRQLAGRWFSVLGIAAAVLIFVGVFSPLHLPLVDPANFVGYVLWSIWLVVFAVILLRSARTSRSAGAGAETDHVRA
jgi:hypothetical protein